MASSHEIDSLLGDLVGRMRAAWGDRLRGVALFGSRARGDARPDSDVDLFVVVEGLPPDRGPAIHEALGSLPFQPCVSLVLRTPDDFEHDVRPMHLDLGLDGRVLYEHDGYLSARLERLRVLIREAKLRRLPSLFWEWEQPPTRRDWAITWEGVRR